MDDIASTPGPGSSGAGAPGTTAAEERLWTGGKGEPMPIRELPEAFNPVHILGPAMILVALGVGLGETYLWPRLVILFGPDIRWLFLVGVTIQAFVMLEMSRYAMATGESIFFGAARIFKPLMWFFFVIAIAVYIWPGHISAGADAFEHLTGIPWQVSAVIGMIVIGVVYTFAKIVYNIVETLLTVLVGVLVGDGGSCVGEKVAVMLGLSIAPLLPAPPHAVRTGSRTTQGRTTRGRTTRTARRSMEGPRSRRE